MLRDDAHWAWWNGAVFCVRHPPAEGDAGCDLLLSFQEHLHEQLLDGLVRQVIRDGDRWVFETAGSDGQQRGQVRLFRLIREADVSGVSGTGHIADGVVWSDGTVTVQWLGDWPTTQDHPRGIASVEHIHGHGGATRIEWVDQDSVRDHLDTAAFEIVRELVCCEDGPPPGSPHHHDICWWGNAARMIVEEVASGERPIDQGNLRIWRDSRLRESTVRAPRRRERAGGPRG